MRTSAHVADSSHIHYSTTGGFCDQELPHDNNEQHAFQWPAHRRHPGWAWPGRILLLCPGKDQPGRARQSTAGQVRRGRRGAPALRGTRFRADPRAAARERGLFERFRNERPAPAGSRALPCDRDRPARFRLQRASAQHAMDSGQAGRPAAPGARADRRGIGHRARPLLGHDGGAGDGLAAARLRARAGAAVGLLLPEHTPGRGHADPAGHTGHRRRLALYDVAAGRAGNVARHGQAYLLAQAGRPALRCLPGLDGPAARPP